MRAMRLRHGGMQRTRRSDGAGSAHRSFSRHALASPRTAVAARAEQSNSGSEEEYIDEEGRRIVGGIGSQLVYIGQVRLLLCSVQPEKTETNVLIADVKVGALDVCVCGARCRDQGRWKWTTLENYPEPGKELGGLTGGWPGGELAFKEDLKPSDVKEGQRVRVRGGGIRRWMRNPLFAASTLGYSGQLGRVVRSEIDSGSTRVAVMLDAPAPPSQAPDTDTSEWSKTVIFDSRDLELVD